jgi:glucokinase
MLEKTALGVDIGGSHITCVAVDLAVKKILESSMVRLSIDSQAGSEQILSGWSEALLKTMRQCPTGALMGIGFAMPGPFDYPGGLALFSGVKKYDSLYRVNIRDEMVKRLNLPASLPVRFLNDATCFAIGEAWLGRASSFNRTVAITLGTGFGSAFLDKGIPVESGDEVPQYGCLYHLPYKVSNADDHFSTRWFLSNYRQMTGKKAGGVKELADEAQTDEQIKAMFCEFGNNLGHFLAPWLNRFRAGCLTIGGNIAYSFDLFRKPFLDALAEENCSTEVMMTSLNEMAAVAGSARLADDSFYAQLPFISNK